MALIIPRGRFWFHAYNADGTLAWREMFSNGMTTAGVNSLLDVYFRNQSQIATWYAGLIDNADFTAVAITDTATKITTATPTSSTNSWRESTAYDEAVRQTWTPGAASGGSIINGAKPTFTISTNNTRIKGAFLVSSNTKGGTAGTMWATGILATARTLNDNQILTVDYETEMVGGST